MSNTSRRIVGIRHPQWSSFGPETLVGVIDFMRDHDPWRIVTENNSYGEMEAVQIDADWHGDGLILFRSTEDELQSFRRRGVSVVLTSTEGPDLGFPRVVPDNLAVGAQAAGHLLSCGLNHFAFVARGETFYREAQFAPGFRVYARERLRGFREALSRLAIEPRIHYLRGRPLWEMRTWREVQTEVAAFLQALPRPCGLFVVDDSLAAVVLRAADTLGLKVPRDLAVIGYGDDHAYCYASYPALSSMVHPAREIGRLAAGLLARQMDGEKVEGVSRVAIGKTVGRESSDTLAIDDPVVRDLVGWIRQASAHDAIRVSDLTDRCALSATTIKERFARHLGHSPKQEIKEARLRHLRRLLEDPVLGLSEIAERMGFASAHELSRFFASATGSRPSEFRARLSQGRPAPGAGVLAVIFDMDGTLFDSETIFYEAFSRAFAEQGGQLRREDYFRHHSGTTNEAIESHLAEIAPAGFDAVRFARAWRDWFNSLLDSEGLRPFPDVVDALGQLRELGVPLALASSSDVADIAHLLEMTGLDDIFTCRTGGDEVERGKPDPEIFLRAARRVGIPAERCVVVEDSTAGVAAARAAGMRVIHVERSPDRNDSAAAVASRTVTTLAQVEWSRLNEWIPAPGTV